LTRVIVIRHRFVSKGFAGEERKEEAVVSAGVALQVKDVLDILQAVSATAVVAIAVAIAPAIAAAGAVGAPDSPSLLLRSPFAHALPSLSYVARYVRVEGQASRQGGADRLICRR